MAGTKNFSPFSRKLKQWKLGDLFCGRLASIRIIVLHNFLKIYIKHLVESGNVILCSEMAKNTKQDYIGEIIQPKKIR